MDLEDIVLEAFDIINGCKGSQIRIKLLSRWYRGGGLWGLPETQPVIFILECNGTIKVKITVKLD